jgi:hypothetical protein
MSTFGYRGLCHRRGRGEGHINDAGAQAWRGGSGYDLEEMDVLRFRQGAIIEEWRRIKLQLGWDLPSIPPPVPTEKSAKPIYAIPIYFTAVKMHLFG